MNHRAQIRAYNIYKSERDWVQKSHCVVHIFTVQVVILFNRQLIKLWKGAQTPWEKLEKDFFFSLSKCIVKGRKACYKESKQQEENMFLRFH